MQRDDVATTLALFADSARREQAAGLSFDLVGGDVAIEEGFDAAIQRGDKAFVP